MIAYIFGDDEIRALCGLLKISCLAKHQFPDKNFDETVHGKAVESLRRKNFVVVREGSIIVNNGIAVMLESLGTAERLLIGEADRIFTGYICKDISVLLINDMNSSNYLLYPFENEDMLINWLRDNGIYSWKDIRLEE